MILSNLLNLWDKVRKIISPDFPLPLFLKVYFYEKENNKTFVHYKVNNSFRLPDLIIS